MFRHLKFSRIAALLGIFIMFTLTCCSRREEPLPQTPTTQLAKIFMWKATGKSGGAVYLVGSMHLAVPDIYPLPKPMEEAFAKSDALVVEVDITKIDQAAMMKKIQETGMYAGEDSLSKHLSKETKAAFDAYCKDNSLPAPIFEKMKPWMAVITIEELTMQKAGLDPANGIDMHFLTAANKDKKSVREFETADFQLDLMAGLEDNFQDKQLADTLKEMATITKQIGTLKDAWQSGDAKAMNDIITKDSKNDADAQVVMKKILYDRNGPMAEKIIKDLDADKTTFVVVGAAHLAGDKGIIHLLTAKGYTVTQSRQD